MIMGNMLKILRGCGKKDKYVPLDQRECWTNRCKENYSIHTRFEKNHKEHKKDNKDTETSNRKCLMNLWKI